MGSVCHSRTRQLLLLHLAMQHQFLLRFSSQTRRVTVRQLHPNAATAAHAPAATNSTAVVAAGSRRGCCSNEDIHSSCCCCACCRTSSRSTINKFGTNNSTHLGSNTRCLVDERLCSGR